MKNHLLAAISWWIAAVSRVHASPNHRLLQPPVVEEEPSSSLSFVCQTLQQEVSGWNCTCHHDDAADVRVDCDTCDGAFAVDGADIQLQSSVAEVFVPHHQEDDPSNYYVRQAQLASFVFRGEDRVHTNLTLVRSFDTETGRYKECEFYRDDQACDCSLVQCDPTVITGPPVESIQCPGGFAHDSCTATRPLGQEDHLFDMNPCFLEPLSPTIYNGATFAPAPAPPPQTATPTSSTASLVFVGRQLSLSSSVCLDNSECVSPSLACINQTCTTRSQLGGACDGPMDDALLGDTTLTITRNPFHPDLEDCQDSSVCARGVASSPDYICCPSGGAYVHLYDDMVTTEFFCTGLLAGQACLHTAVCESPLVCGGDGLCVDPTEAPTTAAPSTEPSVEPTSLSNAPSEMAPTKMPVEEEEEEEVTTDPVSLPSFRPSGTEPPTSRGSQIPRRFFLPCILWVLRFAS